eukprot:1786388-Pleurochrysis_carterae.AAC.2
MSLFSLRRHMLSQEQISTTRFLPVRLGLLGSRNGSCPEFAQQLKIHGLSFTFHKLTNLRLYLDQPMNGYHNLQDTSSANFEIRECRLDDSENLVSGSKTIRSPDAALSRL